MSEVNQSFMAQHQARGGMRDYRVTIVTEHGMGGETENKPAYSAIG